MDLSRDIVRLALDGPVGLDERADRGALDISGCLDIRQEGGADRTLATPPVSKPTRRSTVVSRWPTCKVVSRCCFERVVEESDSVFAGELRWPGKRWTYRESWLPTGKRVCDGGSAVDLLASSEQ
jgi:hypothetical protein